MEIRHLRSFAVLAEELHFGRAAQRLHVAQPALSQQLKTLERELGLRLVDRTNRRVGLTDAGERLLIEATAVLARFDAAMASMARVRTGSVGRLVLGVSPGAAPAILRDLLEAVATGGESPEIEPRAVSSAEGITGLERNELDAILVHSVPDEPALSHLVLARQELGVALPSGHRLVRQRAIAPAKLSGEPLIWLRRRTEPALHDDVFGVLTAAGYEPGPPRGSANVETSLSLVAAGLGISFKLAHEVSRGRHVGVVWRPFDGVRVTVPTTLVWRRGDRAPLLTALVRAARKLQAQT